MKREDILYLIKAIDEVAIEAHDKNEGRWPKHLKDMYEGAIRILQAELKEQKK